MQACSESQERMLLVPKPGLEQEVRRILKNGSWTYQRLNRYIRRVAHGKGSGQRVVQVPAKALTDEAPSYERPLARLRTLMPSKALNIDMLKEPKDFNEVLLTLLSSPTIATKNMRIVSTITWSRQIRSFCRARTRPLVRIKGRDQALALTVDGNSHTVCSTPTWGP
jgi:phosphoribosylformylglycinamidine synthase